MTYANQGYVPVPLAPVASGRDILTDLERAHRPPTIQFVNDKPVVRTEQERKAARAPKPKKEKPEHSPLALWPALVRENGDALREAYEAGTTTAALARQYKVAPPVMRKALVALGLKMRDDRGLGGGVTPTSVSIEAVKAMRAKGMSRCAIAKHFGVSEKTVRRRLNAAGVDIRDLGPVSKAGDPERVLALAAKGLTNVEIAAELGVSRECVREFRKRLEARVDTAGNAGGRV